MGTRLGRQEIEAELLTDTPGALWHMERIEELRVRVAPQPFERVVVSVDPSVTYGPDSDECGIVIAGLGRDRHCYVLHDLSARMPPEEWARRAIQAYRTHAGDRVLGETNNGGALVEATLRSVDPGIPYKAVHASRGKLARAEPVAALYDRGVVHHVGTFGSLEDQMSSYDGSRSGPSPDRLDALVWAITELALGEPAGRFIREEALLLGDAGEGARPVKLPREVASVLVVASIVESAPDALVTVYFAATGGDPPVVVLDWDLVLLEQGTLDAYFPAVRTRLEELVQFTNASNTFAPLLVEPAGLAAILLAQGEERGHRVMALSDEKLLSKELRDRVVEVGNYLANGGVKLAQAAHEKAITFKGVTRNHLTAELSAFRLADEKPKIGPLLAAFATAALHILSENYEGYIWRGFARPAPRPPDSVADRWRASSPAAALLTGFECMHEIIEGPNGPKGLARKAANEAKVELENQRERAAAAERARRMGRQRW